MKRRTNALPTNQPTIQPTDTPSYSRALAPFELERIKNIRKEKIQIGFEC